MNPTAWGIVIDQEPSTFRWIDILWLIFLAALAVLPPLVEIHKQMILVGIGLFQIFESKILADLKQADSHQDHLFVNLNKGRQDGQRSQENQPEDIYPAECGGFLIDHNSPRSRIHRARLAALLRRDKPVKASIC